MWPAPRAPISSTTHSTSSGRIEQGQRDPELVVEGPLAGRRRGRSTPGSGRSRSLVVVLPTEPVMPTTPPADPLAGQRAQVGQRTPRCPRTTMAVPPAGCLREVR